MQDRPSFFTWTWNDTLSAIAARRSVRTFTGDDIADQEIKVLLHAANMRTVGPQSAVVAVHGAARRRRSRAWPSW